MKLNLGCGNDIKKDYINLDCANIKGVDVVHNLDNLPLPFESNVFDEIVCIDIIEHIENYILLLKEIYRILRPGGEVIIRVPHFTSANYWADPTHKHNFSSNTFNFFVENNSRNYYFDFHFSKIIKNKITFSKNKYKIYGYLMEPIVNLHKKFREIYEYTGLCNLFPAENVIIALQK